jgi:hypothetical protein
MSSLRSLRGPMTAGVAVLVAVSCRTRTEAVRTHMQEHFTQAGLVHAAVVAGDLAAVAAPARWIAEHDPVDAPASWDPYISTMRREASVLLTASDIEAAAASAASLIRTCGDCHGSLSEGVTFTASPGPIPEPGAVPHMRRHNWAAERMWEGLAMPSVEAWNQGAAALDEAPLTAEELNAEPEVTALAQHVHDLGRAAAAALTWRARTDVYGQLIATCAACHQQLRTAATQ